MSSSVRRSIVRGPGRKTCSVDAARKAWTTIRRILHLVRWGEWCDTKLPLYLAGLCYAALALPSRGVPELRAAGWLVLLTSR